jgi:integrase
MPSRARLAFDENARDIDRLFGFHLKPALGGGTRPAHQTEVLNKSAVVLLTAYWEAHCEDVVAEGLEHLVSEATDARSIPLSLQKRVARELEAGERDLPLPAFVARALKRHKAAQGERLLALGIVPELVVDNGIGEPWMPASFSTGWRRFAKAHGFEGITFHTLRHGAATLLLAGGVADAVAIKLMGHADTKILRRYQEVVDELQRDAAARMDALLG